MGSILTDQLKLRVVPHPNIVVSVYDISSLLKGSALPDNLDSVVSQDEQIRASRYRKSDDKVRYLMGKFFVRMELANAINCHPSDLDFTITEFGKPQISNPSVGLSFNISHSGAMIALAISSMPVGVDIELNSGFEVSGSLCDQVMSPSERRELFRMSHDVRAIRFLHFWTRKEAILKAAGSGIVNAHRLSTHIDRDHEYQWNVASICVSPDYGCAVGWFDDHSAAQRWLGVLSQSFSLVSRSP